MFYNVKENLRGGVVRLTENELRFGRRANVGRATRQAEFSTTSTDATVLMAVAGPVGYGVWVEWGDGSEPSWHPFAGPGSPQNVNHNFGGLVGTKRLLLRGDVDKITSFYGGTALLQGKAASLSAMDKASLFYLSNGGLTGGVDAFAALINATAIGANGAVGLSGNIANFANLPALYSLTLGGVPVTGALGSLATRTTLITLQLYSTGVSGNVDDLATLSLLTQLHLHNNSGVHHSPTTLPAWSGCEISLTSLAWTATEVDNFLIDLNAAGGSNGVLYIAGSNAARTAASDAAKAGLLARGWAITVNE